jgi:hypothetical protein
MHLTELKAPRQCQLVHLLEARSGEDNSLESEKDKWVGSGLCYAHKTLSRGFTAPDRNLILTLEGRTDMTLGGLQKGEI